MIVEFVTSLNFEATSVRVFNGLFTLIFFVFLFLFEFTIQKAAPFLIASSANLLPSFDLPLRPKKISFFLISFELIKIFFEFIFLFIFFKPQFSFNIFNFQSLKSLLFFFLIS